MDLGQNENSLAEHQDALRVESNGVLIYENLALSYFSLNRFDEATATVNQAFTRHLDDAGLHTIIQADCFSARRCPNDAATAGSGVWGSRASRICLWQPRLTSKPRRVISGRLASSPGVPPSRQPRVGRRRLRRFWQVAGRFARDGRRRSNGSRQASGCCAGARPESRHTDPCGFGFRARRERQIGQERLPINSITSFPSIRSCNPTGCPRFEPQSK